MTNNYDYEAAKKLIYGDNVNVTETNPLKEFAKICVQLILILVSIYLSVYFLSGILLYSLSEKRQVQVENFISPKIKADIVNITVDEENRIYKVRNKILNVDKAFPKTSNLEIKIIKDEQLNALCYPNGNIYITDSLYKELNTEEKLAFVLAHEMAHYRHKDHLMNLRRGISNGIALIILAIANQNSSQLNSFVERGLDVTDLKFSRGVEAKADKYAVMIMNRLYGSAKAGAEVMNILKDKNSYDIEFLSTHPNIDRRINYINNH